MSYPMRAGNPVTQGFTLPAPTKGMDTQSGPLSVGETSCLFLRDMLPRLAGVSVRAGWRKWATEVGKTPEGAIRPIRTIIPFRAGFDTGLSKLFVATGLRIYDVSSGNINDPPSAFTPTGGNAADGGFYSQLHFTTAAGALSWLGVDGYIDGVLRYSGGVWSQIPIGGGAGSIQGPPAGTKFSQVAMWKRRIWFTQVNSTTAWFANQVDSITGNYSKFEFGPLFRKGGFLAGIYNWTIDGGAGIDDYFVAVSTAGDVVIFQGTDPSSFTTFSMRGVWYVGPTPKGNRFVTTFGGDLFILSEYGLTPLSRIIEGAVVSTGENTVSAAIVNLLSRFLVKTLTQRGWEVSVDVNRNVLVISTPKEVDQDWIQFVMELTNQAWAYYTKLPILTADMYGREYFFGDDDGTVGLHTGARDAVELDNTGGENIDWALLSRFSDLGAPGRFKRGQMIRATFLANAAPNYTVEFRYDFNLGIIAVPPPPNTFQTGLWDLAFWNQDFWGGGYEVAQTPRGGHGMGHYVGYAIRGNSYAETALIGVDMMVDSGGFM